MMLFGEFLFRRIFIDVYRRLDVFPDKTGLVRRIRVKTAHATMMRDIRKLCLQEAAN